MQKHRRIRKQRRRHLDEQTVESSTEPAPGHGDQKSDRRGPLYNAGPVHELSPRAEQPAVAEAEEQAQQGHAPAPGDATTPAGPSPERAAHPIALPPITSHDSRADQRTIVEGKSIRIQGRTDSGDFNYSSSTENIKAVPASGCSGCGDCLRVTGTLIVTYTVNPTVTLPSLSDYPNLTPCQQRRVQDAIQNVLAPHEKQHVDAFRTYAGTTRRTFDLTICRSQWNEEAVDAMVKPEQAARQAAAIAASKALDPFYFDVDLDCTDTPPKTPSKQSVTEQSPTEKSTTGDEPESVREELPA